MTFFVKMAKKLINSGFNMLNLVLPTVMLTNKSNAELMLYALGGLSLHAGEASKILDPVHRMRLV